MRALVAVVVLSGCLGATGGAPLSQEDALTATETAIEAFERDFTRPDGGALRLVEGVFDEGASSFTIEWGTAGATRIEIYITEAGESTSVALHCNGVRTTITYGEQVVEARPGPDKTCLEALQENAPGDFTAVENRAVLNVTAHKDGTITGEMEDDVVAHIDRQGRLIRLDLDDGSMVMDYGPRRAIDVPEASIRMPLMISGSGDVQGNEYRWSARPAAAGPTAHSAPYGEIEVRVEDSEGILAAFSPPHVQEEAGFTFRFGDDGDGRFGAGDTFVIEHASWNATHSVVVWDLWAQRAVDDAPIPAAGLAFLFVAALALAATRR